MTDAGGNPFANVMKQVQDAQANIKKIQEELAVMEVSAEAGAGMVKVTGLGNGEVKTIWIDDSVYSEKKEILEGLLVAAMNDFRQKLQQQKDALLKDKFQGFPLPPGFNFPNLS